MPQFDLSTLSVGSLNFAQIKQNIINFLKQYPEFTDYDLSNPSSSSGLFLDILAANTAYQGFYLQQCLSNSFVSSATNQKSLLLLGSNLGILLKDSISSRVSATIENTTDTEIPSYSIFNGVSSSGVQISLFNISPIPAYSNDVQELVTGYGLAQFGNFNLVSQSLLIPYNYDPTTIRVFINDVEWTYVDRTTNISSSEIFTIINSIEGYVVSTNIEGGTQVSADDTVAIYAVSSTGSLVSSVSINSSPTGTIVSSVGETVIGHDPLSISYLKTFVVNTNNSRNRAVTQGDYQSSTAQFLTEQGLATEPEDVDVTSPSVGNINVYVVGVTDETAISNLMTFLDSIKMAGISVAWSA